ncbi:MAG: GNAT family N-acetyltransferase [Acidiferrobacteraceae bacterium]
MNITVRQAILSDIEALIPLFDGYRQFYGRESNLDGAREFLLARFNHGESTLFIAQAAGSGIGFSQLYPSFSSVSLARIFILNDLFVAENHRQHGAGKLLIAAAVDFAKSLGAAGVTLSTGVTNAPAQALYDSCGWKRDEQFIVYHYAI